MRGKRQSYLVNLGEGLDFGTVQDSESQADHLQILGTSGGGDVARLCADVVDDASVKIYYTSGLVITTAFMMRHGRHGHEQNYLFSYLLVYLYIRTHDQRFSLLFQT